MSSSYARQRAIIRQSSFVIIFCSVSIYRSRSKVFRSHSLYKRLHFLLIINLRMIFILNARETQIRRGQWAVFLCSSTHKNGIFFFFLFVVHTGFWIFIHFSEIYVLQNVHSMKYYMKYLRYTLVILGTESNFFYIC